MGGTAEEEDQEIFKTYLFLCECANTTVQGSLRLVSGNYYSDVFSLLRILYEIASLQYYGNLSMTKKHELYRSLFRSGLPENDHRRKEWQFIRKSEAAFESENPDLIPLRQHLNNYGAHISRMKIVMGNVGLMGDAACSTVFTPNFGKPLFLMALDDLYGLSSIILEQWVKHNEYFRTVPEDTADRLRIEIRRFSEEIRPVLHGMQRKDP